MLKDKRKPSLRDKLYPLGNIRKKPSLADKLYAVVKKPKGRKIKSKKPVKK